MQVNIVRVLLYKRCCTVIPNRYISRGGSLNPKERMLRDYEEQVLFRMFDNKIIAMNYCAVEKVASIIKWPSVATEYQVKKNFSSVLDHLHSKGYVDYHGKSGNVASLTRFGVAYVIGVRSKS
jgi:hypothetical protein